MIKHVHVFVFVSFFFMMQLDQDVCANSAVNMCAPVFQDKHGRDSWKLAEGVPEGLLKLRGIQMTRG